MKNHAIFNQLAIITMLSILLLSCNNAEKDWNNAKLANSKSSYQEFIKRHSASAYAEIAQRGIDSIEWVVALKTHSVDSLELFIKNHNSSKFLSTSKVAMDSVEWNIAFYSRDTLKLASYINKYPNSNNKQKAEDIIWEIHWPPITVEKANSLIIGNENGGHGYGTQMFFQGGNGVAAHVGGMAPEVYIWRKFKLSDLESAKKLGLRTGIAYLHEYPNKFKFIRKIDLNKTDKQLCTEFGIRDE